MLFLFLPDPKHKLVTPDSGKSFVSGFTTMVNIILFGRYKKIVYLHAAPQIVTFFLGITGT